MSTRKPLLSPSLKAYAAERYLADVPPRDLAQELKDKFGVEVPSAALRQWLTRSGLGKRRKVLDAKTCSLVSSAKVEALAKKKASDPRGHLVRWAEKTVTVADKALDMASAATKPRDLASAAAAANSAIRMYRLCAGLDGPETGPRVAFNFNFSNVAPLPHPPRVAIAPGGHTEIARAAALGQPAARVVAEGVEINPGGD